VTAPVRAEPRSRNPIVRIGIMWFITALALLIMSVLQQGLDIPIGRGVALAAAAVIGLVNALLWPYLSVILVPFAVLTFGIGTFILNGIVIWIAGEFVPGFSVANLGAAIVTAIGVTVVSVIATTILTIDDEGSFSRAMIRRRMRGQSRDQNLNEPGVIFLEIDGLARPVLEKAIAAGFAPTLASWIERGSHSLHDWETDLSSQTSASQAGLLHRNNSNIPAFRWYDRARRKVVASSNPDELLRIERGFSDGHGLLAQGGASRGNLFSGDAPHVMNTASTIKDLSKLHFSEYRAYFLDPQNFTRTVVLSIWDMILEWRQFRYARRNNVTPIMDKHHRGGTYPLLRAFTAIVQRELNTYTLIGDMFGGVPSAYATFVGYDEVAHHSGVESPDAFDTLRKLDQQFARLESASRLAARPYHFVVLSDHGQSGGPTFKQRYGTSLEEVVRSLLVNQRVEGDSGTNEDWGHLNVFLTDTIKSEESAKPLERVLRGRTEEGNVLLGPESHDDPDDALRQEGAPDVMVLASGNLALVYGTNRSERVTLEEVEEAFPGLLGGLTGHDGIGFVMLNSREHGPVAIGRGGRSYLRDGRVEGVDPLAPFGPNAARHLLRYNEFPDAPDAYINSFYDPAANEVAAFEELIGCHGGLGGYQTRPFLLHPVELDVPSEPLVGAETVGRVLQSWLPREGAPAAP
jgi:uncharacterized membrane protein YvlD (DUF360 family)